MEWLTSIPPILLYLALAGAAGGLCSFLHALRGGRIRNGKYLRKAILEIVGGTLVGFFVSLPFSAWHDEYRIFLAFASGVAWAILLEYIREKITKVIEAALGRLDKSDSERKDK